MNTFFIGGIIFASAFSGAVIGAALRGVLPPDHLSRNSREIIVIAMGLIASMAALVLGLLIASATSEFSSQKAELEQLATDLILVDRMLAHYGPESQPARVVLKQSLTEFLARHWPGSMRPSDDQSASPFTGNGERVLNAIRELKPANELQRGAQMHALELFLDAARTRWNLSQHDETSIPQPFLVVLAFWLFVLFASFGLFAPNNATVMVVLFVCALSVAAAVMLIVDLDHPFEGLIQIPNTPLRHVLAQMGK